MIIKSHLGSSDEAGSDSRVDVALEHVQGRPSNLPLPLICQEECSDSFPNFENLIDSFKTNYKVNDVLRYVVFLGERISVC